MIIDLNNTLGAAFIGNVVAAILFGLASIQTFIFFTSCNKDSRWLRVQVLALWLLNGLHLTLVTHAIYYYTVSDRSELAILVPTWSIPAQLFVTCLTDLLVRYVFGRRVWRLSRKNRLLAFAIGAFSLIVFSTGTAFGLQLSTLRSFSEMERISWLFYSSLAAAVIADFVIAASLCVLFYKGRTGNSQTDALLTIFMLYSINTGLITGLASIACLVTYALIPSQYYYMAIFFALPGLNVNCLLASLNARTPLRERLSQTFAERQPSITSQGQTSQNRRASASSDRTTESSVGVPFNVRIEALPAMKWLELNNKPSSLDVHEVRR